VSTVLIVLVALSTTFGFVLLLVRLVPAGDVRVRLAFTPWPRLEVLVRGAGNGSATAARTGPECGIVPDMVNRPGRR
jgi:hypothetical protein